MNILVVEDERNLADAIVRILEGASYNAEAVYDGTSRGPTTPSCWT